MRIELDEGQASVVNIKVIGIGGGGNNVINRMCKTSITNIDYIAVNTDKQHLRSLEATTKVQIGEKLTGGRGAGSRPEVGRKSAEETRNELAKAIENTDMLFITAGLGGGTGTGAAPVVADLARELGILTVGVVTKPFKFEGALRMEQAEKGIEELFTRVDSLVVIPNENLKLVAEQKITLANAFAVADNVLQQAVQSIYDLIMVPGLINLDFNDVATIMRDAGYAHMGVGVGTGKTKAEDAARMAIQSPLLESSINGATGVLVNVTSSTDLSMEDVDIALSMVRDAAHPRVNIIIGAIFDENLQDQMKITVIATGFDRQAPQAAADYEEGLYSTVAAKKEPPAQPMPNFAPPSPTPTHSAEVPIETKKTEVKQPAAQRQQVEPKKPEEADADKFIEDIMVLFGKKNKND